MRVGLTQPFRMYTTPQDLDRVLTGPIPDARWRYGKSPYALGSLGACTRSASSPCCPNNPATDLFPGVAIPSWYSNAVAQAASAGYSIPVLVNGAGNVMHVNPDGTYSYTIGGAIPGATFNDPVAPCDSSFVAPPAATWASMIAALGIQQYVADYGPSGVDAASAAAAAVATAPANLSTYFMNPATTTSVTPTGAAPGVSLAFITSRGGTVLQAGDTWTIRITGATPGSTVSASGMKSGQNLGTNAFGTIKSDGTFTLNGTIDNNSVGSWSETWYVGSQTAGQISFSVVTTGTAPAPITGTGGPVVTVQGTATPGSSLSTLLSGNVGGIPTSYLLIGGGVLVLLLFMGGRH